MDTSTLASSTRTEHTGLFFLPDMALQAIEGALAGRSFAVHGDGAVLGRDGTIALRTAGVSRQHASLRYSFGRFFIVDLESRNGTFVNGQRVAGERALEPGDLVQIAEHRFLVSLGGSSNGKSIERVAVEPPSRQPLDSHKPFGPRPRSSRSRSSIPLLVVSMGGLALLLVPSLGWKHVGHQRANAASLQAVTAASPQTATLVPVVNVLRAPSTNSHNGELPIQVIRLPMVTLEPTHHVRIAAHEKLQTVVNQSGEAIELPRNNHHQGKQVATRPSPPALDAKDTATLQELASEALDTYRDARRRYHDVLDLHGDPAVLFEARHTLDEARNRARALRLSLPGDPPVQ